MFEFLAGNMPTLFVGAIVAALLAAVIIKMIRDKKKGKSSCGCANCPSSSICHTK